MAVVSIAAALGLAILIDPIRLLSPFFLFYAAVALSSWYGGLGPGLVATLLGAVLAAYFALPPAGSFMPMTVGDSARLLLFVMVGALIAGLNGELHKAYARCAVDAHAARVGEARARRLAESNLIAVFFSDLNGSVRWGNEAFARLIGRRPEDLRGSKLNWLELTAPEHRHLDAQALDEVRRCRVCRPFEKECLHRDGHRVPVLMGCALLDGSDDECVAFVVDLTEQKRSEAEIRSHQDRLHALASELMRAEERERRRIAVVLHDSVNASLALARRKIHALQRAGASPQAVADLEELGRIIDDTIQRTRSLTSELSPPVLYELGLAPALQWLCERFGADRDPACAFEADDRPKPLGDEARLVLFRAARELLSNVQRHAKAQHCLISLRREGHSVRMTVEDDGRGFDTRSSGYSEGRSGGFGLFNIRERLVNLGGKLEITSGPGRGTTASIVVPLQETPAPSSDVEGTTHEHQNSSGR